LHLWNEKVLEAIGNNLSCFICVDTQSLTGPNKKLAKVLVEIDIHGGFLEFIDIDWRGKHFRQSLDYLGIPFRCTLCRRTGYLRNACSGLFIEEQAEETLLEQSTQMESPILNSHLTYLGLPDYEDS